MNSHHTSNGSVKGGLVGFAVVLAFGWAFANMNSIAELARFAG